MWLITHSIHIVFPEKKKNSYILNAQMKKLLILCEL